MDKELEESVRVIIIISSSRFREFGKFFVAERGVDVSVAQAELVVAEAAVNQAQADLELAYVKSPIGGQILEINTWSGEMVNKTEGIENSFALMGIVKTTSTN